MNKKQAVEKGPLVRLRKQGMFDGKIGHLMSVTKSGHAVVKFDGINHYQTFKIEILEVADECRG